MTAVIIGNSPMLAALKSRLPERAWRVPGADDPLSQSRFLANNPAPAGARGYAFVSESGDWIAAHNAGWTVYWCDANKEAPLGTELLPNRALTATLRKVAHIFWGVNIADSRAIVDLLTGHVRHAGTILFVTSASGGVGKTTSSRRLCERARSNGVSSLLVDANMLQSSQRSFFDPAHRLDVRTIQDWEVGDRATTGANQGRVLGVPYDVVFAPERGQSVSWQHYANYIEEARRLWSLVVVDLDRISALDFDTPNTAASELILPGMTAGDLMLVAVKAGRQTQADAMNMLSALPAHGIEPASVAIKDVLDIDEDTYQPYTYDKVGTFVGVEHQSVQAKQHLANGESGWADDGLDLVREQVLDWALPDRGFNPAQFAPAPQKKHRGLFK